MSPFPRTPSRLPSRRTFVQGVLWVLPLATPLRAFASAGAWAPVPALADLERVHGGRLGVSVLDTGREGGFGHRPDERFALCSTFKLLLASLVLARVDRGEEQLERSLPVTAADLVSNSPVTAARVGTRMTLGELCRATMTTSDNAAANLLLSTVGGPSGLTAFLRSLGDPVTRLDRTEPELNSVDLTAGEKRDTTSPAAMASLMRTLLVGGALQPASVDTLVGWMRETQTGLARVRAGLPTDWHAGDKTGTGKDGPTNDVVVGWPPGRSPLIVTAYFERAGHSMEENSAVLADVGRIVAQLR